jgi:endo-1,4-beta-xylanase
MPKTWDLSLPSLCKKFEKYFKVGCILSPFDFDDAELMEMYKHHYNAVTAENAMKPVYISAAPGEYDFKKADELVDWAEKNGITMIGHTLIWHGQSAAWLNKADDGTPLPRAQARANMEAFIREYVGRYSGRIYSWDVINEAFVDTEDDKPYSGNWREYLRRESDNPRAVGYWYLAYANGANADECGSDYVFDSFYFARKYDPKAVLYFNEYNEEFPHKRHAIRDMVNDINAQWRAHPEYDNRLLIEGIGMQSHHNHIHTNIERIRIALDLFAKTGAKISITEMDFTFGSSTEPATPLTPEQSKKQAEMYKELFKAYMDYSKNVERVTFWGKNDQQSWRAWGSPLFFDTECNAKDAFYAVTALVN